MNDNDILIARKTEGGCKTVVVDGDVADCERINRQIQDRKKAQEDDAKADIAKLEQHQRYLAHMEAAEKAKAKADHDRRRRHVYLTFAMVLSVGGLMALTLTGLMHTVVGMIFIAGAAAAFGWHLGRNR